MRNLDVTIDDVTILDIILKALPNSFSNWKTIDNDQQTLERLLKKLGEKAKEIADDEETGLLVMKALWLIEAEVIHHSLEQEQEA